YREEPDNEIDSGWRFLAGTESDEYMEDADHHAIYDVNTIANYDRDIIPLLDVPAGSAFMRDPRTGKFVEVEYEPEEEAPRLAMARGLVCGTLPEVCHSPRRP